MKTQDLSVCSFEDACLEVGSHAGEMAILELTTTLLGPGDMESDELRTRSPSGNHSRCPAAKVTQSWGLLRQDCLHTRTHADKRSWEVLRPSLPSQKTIDIPTVRAFKQAHLGQTNSLLWIQIHNILWQMETGVGQELAQTETT